MCQFCSNLAKTPLKLKTFHTNWIVFFIFLFLFLTFKQEAIYIYKWYHLIILYLTLKKIKKKKRKIEITYDHDVIFVEFSLCVRNWRKTHKFWKNFIPVELSNLLKILNASLLSFLIFNFFKRSNIYIEMIPPYYYISYSFKKK